MENQWKTFHKRLLLGNTIGKTVLLNNTTIRNTSSGYHPIAKEGYEVKPALEIFQLNGIISKEIDSYFLYTWE